MLHWKHCAEYGLASILSASCSICNHTIQLETSKEVKGPKDYCRYGDLKYHGIDHHSWVFFDRWECNLAAMWAQMCTGGGHSKLQETMSMVGVPVMSKTSSISTERHIGEASHLL